MYANSVADIEQRKNNIPCCRKQLFLDILKLSSEEDRRTEIPYILLLLSLNFLRNQWIFDKFAYIRQRLSQTEHFGEIGDRRRLH